MERSLVIFSLTVTVALMGLVFLASQPAEAGCSGTCIQVSPGCRVCEDAGEETGVICIQRGDCRCLFAECGTTLATLLQQGHDTHMMSVDPESYERGSFASASQSSQNCPSSTDPLAALSSVTPSTVIFSIPQHRNPAG